MTILPKKNVGSNSGPRPRTPPDVDSPNDFQSVSNPSSGNGWGSTSDSSNWTSSGSWVSSGSSPREGEKRPACTSQSFDYDEDCGPSSTKRRYRHSSNYRPRNCTNKTGNNLVIPPLTSSPPLASTSNEGYNSEDEYSHLGKIKEEDGNCLFRSVADLIFGDEEIHKAVRNQCMDYISQNGDYFSQYVTEDLANYVERKRFLGVQGNHLEIQAFSEMYNRPIHIYCYSAEPINIFQNINKTDQVNTPIRLCYHRNVHYNCLVDPSRPTIGMGLGLPNYFPVSTERKLVDQAATDWEATNELIEEQVARESYLQWLRDCERRSATLPSGSNSTSTTSTVTSGELHSSSLKKPFTSSGHISPSAGPSTKHSHVTGSPKAGCSSERDSPKPSSSHQYCKNSDSLLPNNLNSLASDDLCQLTEEIYGFHEWNETDVLTKVMVASQKETHINGLNVALIRYIKTWTENTLTQLISPFEFKDEVEIEQEFTGDLINIDSTSSSSMLENTSIVNSNDTMKDHHYVGDDEDSIFNIPPYAIAKYNFIAQNSNELSLKMGEMIYLSQHINEEWMLGDIDVIYLFDEGSNYRVNFSFAAQMDGDLSIAEGENYKKKTESKGSQFGFVHSEKILKNLEVSLIQSKSESDSSSNNCILKPKNKTSSPLPPPPPPLADEKSQDTESIPDSTNEENSLYSCNLSEFSGDSKYLYARVTRSATSQAKVTSYYEPPKSTNSTINEESNILRHEYDDTASEQAGLYNDSGNKPLRPAPPIPCVSIELQCNNSPKKEEKKERMLKINTMRKQIQDKEKELEDQLLNELDMYQEIAVAKGVNYESLNQQMDDCQENIDTLSDEIQKLQASLTNEEILVEEDNILFRPVIYENDDINNADNKKRKNAERRQLVIKELYATEKKYHENIQILISVIICGSNERTRSITEDILISTLRDIKEISEKILKAQNYQSVLDVFMNNSVKMKSSYTKYCIYHPKVEGVLEKLDIIPNVDINARFNIKSSFIMPVQRILKYPLIINELIKCSNGGDEADYLRRVQNIMADVASSINESKGRKDIVDKYKSMSECGIHQKMIKWNMHGLEKKSFRMKNRLLSSIGFDTMMIDIDFQAIEKKFIYFCQSINYFMIEMKSTNLHLYNSLISQLHFSECIHDFCAIKTHSNSKKGLVEIHKSFLSPYWKTFVIDFEDKIAVLCELLCQSFHGPKRLVQKRRDKYVDLCGALVKLKKNKELSKQADLKNLVSTCRSTYKALNIQLTNDIPKFLILTMGLFKKVIVTYSTSRAKLYGKITKEFLNHIKTSRLSDYNNEEEFIEKYENVIREIKDVSSLLKNQDYDSKPPIPVVADDPTENLAVQCKKQRAKLRMMYEASDLYFVTRTYLNSDSNEMNAYIGDLVGVMIKKEDTKWIVDNGTIKSYLPSGILTHNWGLCNGKADSKQHSSDEPDYDMLHSTTGRMSNHSYEEIATSDFNSESPEDLSPIYEEINGFGSGNLTMALIKGSFQSEGSISSSKNKGKFFYSLYDFIPDQKEETYGQVHVKNMLPLTQGQVIRVLSVEGHDWWFAENRKGRRGYVPKSYLKTYKATLLHN
ncbi:OTUD5 [Lepeophtheirus salmonis]|uniref:OTUD5 n=1 Tax=Lepeophtheirus salmonis TaxID=72036 RepID=A0A7R8H2W9_LEPSM|nr:OTUD5 [Lepeophtheirus salmonis]CAF2822382.1 OTUD5 [Lepeophtheirus salmonis]